MEVILLLVRVFLSGVFLVAGAGKLYDLEGSEKAAKDFGVPEKLAKPVGILLPLIEIAAAIMLLPLGTAWYGGIIVLALLTVFTIGMTVQVAKGNAPDCHCFGQIHSEPVSKKSILRNIALMFAAAYFVIQGRVSPGQGLVVFWEDRVSREYLSYLIGIFAIALLVSMVLRLREMSAKLTEVQQKLDTLELVSEAVTAQNAHQHHEQMTSPDEGLPIGAPVPDFELTNMNGRAVSFEQLMMRGKAMLFFFISPTCAPCKAMLPEIGKWQEEFAGKIEFIFISTGSAEENAAKLQQLGGQTHLLQKKREVAELFKAKWTPTAILVNAEGNFASRPAAGDAAIRDLVDLIREKAKDIDSINYVENGRGMSPNELKIGAVVPEFTLPEVKGETATDELIRSKKTLALFWGTSCPHCDRMLPEVKEWETAGTNGTQLVVFSSGDVSVNRGLGFKAPVLIDEDNKITTELGMFGTPSAVLIDEDGKIVSETAVGAEQIRSLIGKRKLGPAA